ncbi:diguanylate cyclase [Endothiovibrio diazotrophicus]
MDRSPFAGSPSTLTAAADPRQRILVVDDRAENRVALGALLAEFGSGLEVVEAASGQEALRLAFENDFSVILLDVQMPEMDGFEVAELMRGIKRCRNVPILFVTAINKELNHVFRGYQVGAVDYLFKPLQPEILLAKLRVFLEMDRQTRELRRLNRELQETVNELAAAKAVIESQNALLREQAIHDSLTGAYNRGHLDNALLLERRIADESGHPLSLLLMDLDHFKRINDNHGHLFGDRVLEGFAALVRQLIRGNDIFARYGGEEFLLVMGGADLDSAAVVAERIRAGAEALLFEHEGERVPLTVSIGVATCAGDDPACLEGQLRRADEALYTAKGAGRNRIEIAS